MLGTLDVLNTFSTYNVFNLRWVVQDITHCKSRSTCSKYIQFHSIDFVVWGLFLPIC